jgi:hypothetical protein
VCVRAFIDDSDDDDDMQKNKYYGQVEEICEVHYVGLKVALFWCKWATNGKRVVSMVLLVLISESLVTKMNRLTSQTMLSKCCMYLTLQRRTGMCFFLEKRIVEEEEYN